MSIQSGTALKDLADAAKRVDKAAFGHQGDFGQAHQALRKGADFIRKLSARVFITPKESKLFRFVWDLQKLDRQISKSADYP